MKEALNKAQSNKEKAPYKASYEITLKNKEEELLRQQKACEDNELQLKKEERLLSSVIHKMMLHPAIKHYRDMLEKENVPKNK
jgi:hypothetical protein